MPRTERSLSQLLPGASSFFSMFILLLILEGEQHFFLATPETRIDEFISFE